MFEKKSAVLASVILLTLFGAPLATSAATPQVAISGFTTPIFSEDEDEYEDMSEGEEIVTLFMFCTSLKQVFHYNSFSKIRKRGSMYQTSPIPYCHRRSLVLVPHRLDRKMQLVV